MWLFEQSMTSYFIISVKVADILVACFRVNATDLLLCLKKNREASITKEVREKHRIKTASCWLQELLVFLGHKVNL